MCGMWTEFALTHVCRPLSPSPPHAPVMPLLRPRIAGLLLLAACALSLSVCVDGANVIFPPPVNNVTGQNIKMTAFSQLQSVPTPTHSHCMRAHPVVPLRKPARHRRPHPFSLSLWSACAAVVCVQVRVYHQDRRCGASIQRRFLHAVDLGRSEARPLGHIQRRPCIPGGLLLATAARLYQCDRRSDASDHRSAAAELREGAGVQCDRAVELHAPERLDLVHARSAIRGKLLDACRHVRCTNAHRNRDADISRCVIDMQSPPRVMQRLSSLRAHRCPVPVLLLLCSRLCQEEVPLRQPESSHPNRKLLGQYAGSNRFRRTGEDYPA